MSVSVLKIKPRLVVTVIFAVIFGFAVNRFVLLWVSAPIIDPVLMPIPDVTELLSKFIPSLQASPLLFDFTVRGILAFVSGFICVVGMAGYQTLKRSRTYQYGTEHGSARWGTQAESDFFADLKHPTNNIILSQSDRMEFETIKFDPERDRNKNVLVVGSLGTGKTRSLIKPNMMQLNSSYIITDTKGTLPKECGHLFAENGYKVKVFDTKELTMSMHYNPLAYMKNEVDLLRTVTVLIDNTEGEGSQKKEDFWVKSERLLFGAIFGYLLYESNLEDRNFVWVSKLIDMAQVKEGNSDFLSGLDLLFRELETGEIWSTVEKRFVKVTSGNPDHFAVRRYKKFKIAADKTLSSILISCASRIASFDIDEVQNLVAFDELELDKIGSEKTALFVLMRDNDSTFAFLTAILFYQLFNILSNNADLLPGGHLAIPVQCLLDEFANIGKITGYQRTITTIRSRWISSWHMLQSVKQLDEIYGKDAAQITKDACDTFIYLGSQSKDTNEEVSKMIGKATIASRNIAKTTSADSRSSNVSDQLIERDLIQPAELGRMSRTKSIVLIAGAFPFMSKKYDPYSHPLYKYLDPGHKGALFDSDFDVVAYAAKIRGDKEAKNYASGKTTTIIADAQVVEEYMARALSA